LSGGLGRVIERRGITLVLVLLLNRSYEPLYAISAQRAVALLFSRQAAPVRGEPPAAVFRSPSTTIEVPTVICLRRYVNVPRRGAVWSRAGVLKRDEYRCIYCGLRPGDRQRGRTLARADFGVDHIVPLSRGGKSTWGNTACACRRCNGRKNDRTPAEAHMKLLWEPKTPRTSYLVLRGDVPAAWRKYVEV
jgi:5-methylcytosine-specific restriction endonuclease McrA